MRWKRQVARWTGALLAGWAALAGSAVAAAPAAPVELAVTVDDLPAHGPLPPGVSRAEVAGAIVAALKAAGAPPTYGFVNAGQLVREPASAAALAVWRRAGFPLGNHTADHLALSATPFDRWTADVVADEPALEARMVGGDWRWFRYPYLDEGRTPALRARARRFLAARGYRIAQVTTGFDDWAFNAPYARCLAAGDRAAIVRLEGAYLAAAGAELDRSRAMSRTLLGRDIPQVLLMHVGAFDAHMIGRLLALYRARGVRLVALAAAERDPFYRPSVDLASDAPDTLEAALAARGQAPPPHPFDLRWLDGVCGGVSR